MITAQDIREKTFEKSTFGGYAMNEVDDFLDEMADDLAASQKELATMRTKMKVLVDKIEEYRASEEDMHKALVSAQRTARTIEEEAQAKADAILAEAQKKADAMLSEAQEKVASVTGNLSQLRQAEELRLQKAQTSAAECIQLCTRKLGETLSFLHDLQDADLIGTIVTPAPDERKAIAAPAQAEAEEEAVEEETEEAPVEEEVEEAPVEEETEETPVEEEVEEAPAEEEEEPQAKPVSEWDSLANSSDKKKKNATGEPDYFKAFENAVFQEEDGESAIPDAEDGDDAPLFRF